VAKKARIIRPPDDLRRRAVNNTRGLNLELTPQEIARIETAVHRSKDRFITQIAEKLKLLRVSHMQADDKPDTRTGYLGKLRDESLAMKGLGGTYGFPLVTTIAASLNDFVLKRTMVDDRQMTVIRLHIDTLYVLLSQLATLKPDTEGEILASFRIMTSKYA
jgi:hypothetical protein